MIRSSFTGKNGKSLEKEFYSTFARMFDRHEVLAAEMKANGYGDHCQKMARVSGHTNMFRNFSYKPGKENKILTKIFVDIMKLMRYEIVRHTVDGSAQAMLGLASLAPETVAKKDKLKSFPEYQSLFTTISAEGIPYLGLPPIRVSAESIPSTNAWVFFGDLINTYRCTYAGLSNGEYKGSTGFTNSAAIKLAMVLEYGGLSKYGPVPARPLINSILGSDSFKSSYKKILRYHGLATRDPARRKLRKVVGFAKARQALLSNKETGEK